MIRIAAALALTLLGPAAIPCAGGAAAPVARDAWSDYQAAHAKWQADVAALAAWRAQESQYEADLAAWNIQKATYDAAIAAIADYEQQLKAAEAAVRASDVAAIAAQQSVILTESWPGPWLFENDLATWMAGTAAAPASLAVEFVGVKDELALSAVSTSEWDALGASINRLDKLRRSPPTALPPPPGPAPTSPGPQPADPGPEPQPPTIPPPPPATFQLDPSGYVAVATGVRKASANPIRDVWPLLKPGEVAELAGGDYRRADLSAVSARPKGGLPVIFRGPAAGLRARVLRDLSVGSSDNLQLKHEVSDDTWQHIDFQADDRAAIKFVDSQRADGSWYGTGTGHLFQDCRVLGDWDPTSASPTFQGTKWGCHTYMGGATFEDCVFQGIYEEHVGLYSNNHAGDYTFRRCLFQWGGRTALQFCTRTTAGPPATGNILAEDCTVNDVCLQSGGGGSAFTDAGGDPNSNFTLRRCTVRLGCDPNLKAPWNQNITGAVVIHSGQYAFPGGTKDVLLDACDFEVGTVWPGVGSARRSNVNVGYAATLTIRDCRIVQGPNAFPIAIEIDATVPVVRFEGTNVVVGQVKYKGTLYVNFDAFKAANPTLFSCLFLLAPRGDAGAELLARAA